MDCDADRYARYRGEDALMFPVSRTNDRLRSKEVVYGFTIGDVAAAYTEKLLVA